MTMRYPSYRDSDVDWLKEIPSHWPITRLGFECETLVPMRDKPDDLSGPIPWVRIEDFDGKYLFRSQSQQGVSEETVASMNLKVLPVGSVLCSCSCSMGAAAIVKTPLVTNQTFIGIVPGPAYRSEYLYYLFLSAADHLDSIGTGAIQTYLSRDDFRRLRIPKPSLNEQDSIAAFLDSEVAKIDALISEQEKLLALLAEKRQATIAHAVTRGLNSDAPMKYSGISWMGMVPAHWHLCAIGYVAKISTGTTPNRDNPSYWGGEVLWVKTGEVNYQPIRDTEERVTERALKECSLTLTKPGSLLMAMYGQGVTRGRVALLQVAATFNQACVAMDFATQVDPRYAQYFFVAAYEHIRSDGNETSQMNLNSEMVRKLKILSPPIAEQKTIIENLDHRLGRIDAMTIEAKRAVVLLSERRSALIAATVTGKIDVRGEAPKGRQHDATA